MTCGAIVVAGGSGTRFGGAKQFVNLANKSIVNRSIGAARSVATVVVAVVPAGYLHEDVEADVVVEGGTTRSSSVRAGLAALPGDCDVVVVHDGARPLATPALFAAVVDALKDPDVAGAIPGVRSRDTMKVVQTQNGRLEVVSTLDRSTIVAIQTPQAFRAVALRQAHGTGDDASDDAALVEAIGGTIVVVPGDEENIKITTRGDLAMAELVVRQR